MGKGKKNASGESSSLAGSQGGLTCLHLFIELRTKIPPGTAGAPAK